MMIRGQKKISTLAIIRPVAVFYLQLGLLAFSTVSLNSQTTDLVFLNETLVIPFGDHSISLSKGTLIQVLQEKNGVATVSLKLPDGSPLITQISLSSLKFSVPQPAEPLKSHDRTLLQGPSLSSTLNKTSAQYFPATDSRKDDVPPEAPLINPLDKNDDNGQTHPNFNTTLSSLDAILPTERYTSLNGYFYVLINGMAVPVVYSLPMEGQHLAKSASNLIFYGPYPSEQTKLTGNIIPKLVKHLGCSVFSFSFKAKGTDLSNPKTAYWDKESPWFEALMSARDEVVKGFGLESRKLILMGYSGGGGMVLNLAGAYSDDVEAVAAQGANLVPEITEKTPVKWLIINNRGEVNSATTIPFYENLRSLGCAALYCETTPERGRGHYHAPSQQAYDLIYSYIAAILDQRALDNKGINDIQHLWPYASPSDPLKRYAIVKTSDLDDKTITSGTFDLLPSAAFALNWSKVCPPTQTIKSETESETIQVTFPAREKPLGTIIYFDQPGVYNITRIVEDVHALAEHGCVVISPSRSTDSESFTQSAMNWIHSEGSYEASDIHLVGYGASGALFLSSMINETDVHVKSVSLIDFQDSEIDDQTKTNIETVAKNCGMYGFFAYLHSNPNTNLAQLANDLLTNESQQRGCYKLLVTAKMTEDIISADDSRISADSAILVVDNNKIALDNNKMNGQGQWQTPEDQDQFEADQEQIASDQGQTGVDQKQAQQDKKQAQLEQEQVEDQALKMVKDLITKSSS
jgi:pimeloyl-ACP methyl ester carboxylesterase